MSQRIDYTKTSPAGVKALGGVYAYVAQCGLENTLVELVNLRVSQINGCAFCLDMHTKDALKYGETPQRIFLLNAWKDARELYTEEEQVMLAIAEEVTLISQSGLSEETYAKATQFFTETQIADIIMAAVTINMWNRIAISTHMPVAG